MFVRAYRPICALFKYYRDRRKKIRYRRIFLSELRSRLEYLIGAPFDLGFVIFYPFRIYIHTRPLIF